MNDNAALRYARIVERYYETLHEGPAPFTAADWFAVEAWHRLGIPIECVLKGLDRAFSHRNVVIDSLEHCDWAVKQVCLETCSVLGSLSFFDRPGVC